MEIGISWENFEIYIRKSLWKIDFLPIFYPIFPDHCHFIKLWKIRPFFYTNLFGFGMKLPPTLWGPSCMVIKVSLKVSVKFFISHFLFQTFHFSGKQRRRQKFVMFDFRSGTLLDFDIFSIFEKFSYTFSNIVRGTFRRSML